MQRKTSIELYTINKVKEKRKALKISQRQLSTDLNLEMSYVGRVERPNDPSKYNLNHLNALAMYFNCELWDFFPDKPFEDENTKYLPQK
ncbi:helix-turn-helix domain-containing protein [Butyricimonas paravirosa]|uniref:helix-turn-helix domain-containing protein n=1 Tax=Butyricimonas paravirosa TaxID=1472417 RepID=UPI00210B4DA0|nr:helix-turn-helix transcriptional regulator [Butyricimonas paravirosa]MCQ4875690.1 helix-turn-helix transcriptional regulator [Butyricimonas paravirosa]